MKKILFLALPVLGLPLSLTFLAPRSQANAQSATTTQQEQVDSVNVAMQKFDQAVVKRDTKAILSFVSRSKGLSVHNTIWDHNTSSAKYPYLILTKEYGRDIIKSPKQTPLIDTILYSATEGTSSFGRMVKGIPGRKWEQIPSKKPSCIAFIPAADHPLLYKRTQLYVRWIQENGKWVIDEIGHTATWLR